MKKLILLFMSLACVYMTFAQENQITGSVIDNTTKSPLSGATIELVGQASITTNANGKFEVSCTDSKTLTVSFLGYESITRNVKCGENVTIALIPTTRNLDIIEITETSNPNISLIEQPVSIVKLGENEIKRGNGLFLEDALNTNVPGVQMQRRTQSGGQQINIRGYGNGMGFKGVSNNFDGQGSKVYLNGILITDAEGVTVMDDIDFGSISNVEVSKGPSGTLYGLAISGVINLKTQEAEKNKTSLSQDFLMGSYGLLRSTSRVSIGEERSSILLNYGHQEFDGFMDHTASNKDFVNFMGSFDLNKKQKLTTYVGYSESYDQRNGELTAGQYDTLDYSGNARYIANDAHSAIRSFRAGVSHIYKFNKYVSNTSSIFGSAQKMDNSSAGGWTDKTPLNYGFRSTFNMAFRLSEKMNLTGVTGVEMQKMNAITAGYRMSADSTNLEGYNIITDLKSIQASTNSTASYFTQWTLSLPKGFSVNAGIGMSNMAIKLEDRTWGLDNNHPGNTTPQFYETSYTNLISPNFAINKTFSEKASVYTAYSVGYKAPVSGNIIISTTGELNTGLRPEKGAQIEIGTKGHLLDKRLFYTVAAFNAQFSDKFTTQTVQNPENTATLYSYIVNGGNLNNNGVEVLVRYNLIDSKTGFVRLLRPFANLTFSDFKYDDYRFEVVGEDGSGNDSTIVYDYSGNAVAGVSPIVFNAGVDLDTKIGLYGNLTFNYRSQMYYTSDGLNEADPYSLLNAKIGYKRSIKQFDLNVYAGASNIMGTQYYNMVFINQLPDAYIPAPNEINFFGGINLKYNF